MYTLKEYKNLKKKYGAYSSWAIYNPSNESDTEIIDRTYKKLHAKYVFLGLNISKLLKKSSWSNFRGGKHDRKLKYACEKNKLSGSYLTDIFKDLPESNSSKVRKYIQKHSEEIKKNVSHFKKEMRDIKINKNTAFIVLGSDSSFLLKCFNDYLKNEYKNNKVFNYYHYSYYKLTDKKWVEGLWKKLGIKRKFSK